MLALFFGMPGLAVADGAALIDGLVGYYAFDGNLRDSSGSPHTNNAEAVGSPNLSVAGLFGGGVKVGDGAGTSYVSLGTPRDYLFGDSTDFTFTYWIKVPDSFSTQSPLLCNKKRSDSETDRGFVQFVSDDDVGVSLGDGKNGASTGKVDLDPDAYWNKKKRLADAPIRWIFVAMTVNRSAGVVTNYTMDGGVVERWNDQSTPTFTNISAVGSVDSGYPINLGQDGDGRGYDDLAYVEQNCTYDDLAVWRRALGADEIWEIYTAGRAGISFGKYTGIVRETLPDIPRVRFCDPYTAEVLWESETPTDTIVEYGKSEALGMRKADAKPVRKHRLRLDLEWRTKYYYRIGHSGPDGEVFSPVYWFDNAINFSQADVSRVPSPWPDDGKTGVYADAARHILDATGVRKGYALVYGIGDGRLPFELAKRSDLVVVGVDSDAARVEAARAKLQEAGVYGHRVKILHQPDLSALPFSKNFFNLVVSGRAVSDGELVGTAAEARRVARPEGGWIFVGAPSGLAPDAVREWFARAGLEVDPKSGPAGVWGGYARGPLPGAGWWTHQYGTPANTGCAGESLGGATATGDLQLQWIGRPGADSGLDRNPRMPAPVSDHGRLYHQGYNRVMAMDAYNGAQLWSLEIPLLRRVNLPRDTSNMCADERGVFLALRDECWRLDGDTGELLRRYRLDKPGREWGAVFRYGGLLVGTSMPQGSHYLNFLGASYWYNDKSGLRTDKVCSSELFALDPDTGRRAWSYAGGIIIDATLCMGGGRIYFVESRDPAVVARGGGRYGDSLWHDLHLVALDAKSGKTLWDRPISPEKGTTATYMMYAKADDRLVFLTSGTDYRMYTYAAADGAPGWRSEEAWYPDYHSGFMQRPVVVGDRVFMLPRLYRLSDGKVLRSDIGNARGGCPTYSASTGALLFRETERRIAMQDLQTGEVTCWDYLRPSCWLNFTPSGGMFLVPEGGGGCSCNGWINTSIGFTDKEGK